MERNCEKTRKSRQKAMDRSVFDETNDAAEGFDDLGIDLPQRKEYR